MVRERIHRIVMPSRDNYKRCFHGFLPLYMLPRIPVEAPLPEEFGIPINSDNDFW